MLKRNKEHFSKQQVTRAIDQAISKARSFIRIPNAAERKRLTNDRILSSLRRLGVATQAEVEALQSQVQKLEGELLSHSKKTTEKAARVRTKTA